MRYLAERDKPIAYVKSMGHCFGSMADRIVNLRGVYRNNIHMRDHPQPGWSVVEDNSMRCHCGTHFEEHQKRKEMCVNPVDPRTGRPREHVDVL